MAERVDLLFSIYGLPSMRITNNSGAVSGNGDRINSDFMREDKHLDMFRSVVLFKDAEKAAIQAESWGKRPILITENKNNKIAVCLMGTWGYNIVRQGLKKAYTDIYQILRFEDILSHPLLDPKECGYSPGFTATDKRVSFEYRVLEDIGAFTSDATHAITICTFGVFANGLRLWLEDNTNT